MIENILFDCPDCEKGKMFPHRLGPLKNLYKCNTCESDLYLTPKLMKLLSFPYSSQASKTMDVSISTRPSNIPTQ